MRNGRAGGKQLGDMVSPGKVAVAAGQGSAEESGQVLRTDDLEVLLSGREVVSLVATLVLIFIRFVRSLGSRDCSSRWSLLSKVQPN